MLRDGGPSPARRTFLRLAAGAVAPPAAARIGRASGFQGLCAPKETPAEVIRGLNTAVNEAASDPGFKGRLGEFGNTALQGSPQDFADVFATGMEKWSRVIRAANVMLR